MAKLTKEELNILTTLIGQATTTVAQAQKFIDLRNKMSKMAKEQSKEK